MMMKKVKIHSDLIQLLENMSGIYDGKTVKGSNSLSWKAYRIAEQVNDLNLVPELLGFIDVVENQSLKNEAYQLVLFILNNTKDEKLVNELLKRLKREDQNDESLYKLLIGIWESKVKLKKHLESVIYYIDDQRELIRNAAIRLISSFEKDLEIAENALIEVINDPYDNFDLKYGIQSIGLIGSEKSVHELQKIHSKINDDEMKEKIIEAIKKIK